MQESLQNLDRDRKLASVGLLTGIPLGDALGLMAGPKKNKAVKPKNKAAKQKNEVEEEDLDDHTDGEEAKEDSDGGDMIDKVDMTYRRLDKHPNHASIAARAKKHAQEDVVQPFVIGKDKDGDPENPELWKLYDPENLPEIGQTGYHDSSGVSGIPCNVVLSDRAIVHVLDTGISEINRRWRWAANFGADGRVPQRHRNLGRRALDNNGKVIKVKLPSQKGSPAKYITFSGDPTLSANKPPISSDNTVVMKITPSKGTPSRILANGPPKKPPTTPAKKPGSGSGFGTQNTHSSGGNSRGKKRKSLDLNNQEHDGDSEGSVPKKPKVFRSIHTIRVSSDSEDGTTEELEEKEKDKAKEDESPKKPAPFSVLLAKRLVEEVTYCHMVSSRAINILAKVTKVVKKIGKKPTPSREDIKEIMNSLSEDGSYVANTLSSQLEEFTTFMAEELVELLSNAPVLERFLFSNLETGGFTNLQSWITSNSVKDFSTIVAELETFTRDGYEGQQGLETEESE